MSIKLRVTITREYEVLDPLSYDENLRGQPDELVVARCIEIDRHTFANDPFYAIDNDDLKIEVTQAGVDARDKEIERLRERVAKLEGEAARGGRDVLDMD